MDGSRNFYLGEDKYVDFEIRSKSLHTIVITSATYELKQQNTIVLSGQCEINGDRISILLEPPERGQYILEMTYTVAPETRKTIIKLLVV